MRCCYFKFIFIRFYLILALFKRWHATIILEMVNAEIIHSISLARGNHFIRNAYITTRDCKIRVLGKKNVKKCLCLPQESKCLQV